MKKDVLILFSGGIDSTACIHYFKNLNYNIKCLFINYGQLSYKYEQKAVELISKHFNVKYISLDLELPSNENYELTIGRNYFLLSIALFSNILDSGVVSMGVHTETDYYDCSPEFIEKNQIIYDLYTSGSIIINCPFIHLNKVEIYDYCVSNNVPLKLTYSCEIGGIQPCNKCNSCKDIVTLEGL